MGVCALCSYRGPWTQKGSVFGLVFCCHRRETFNNKRPCFLFVCFVFGGCEPSYVLGPKLRAGPSSRLQSFQRKLQRCKDFVSGHLRSDF